MDIFNRSSHKSKLLNYCQIHLYGIEMAFSELREYYDVIEKGLASESGKKIKDYNERYETMLASNTEEGWAAHLDSQYIEQVVLLDYYFPHAFRSSFLIQIFSFVEFELKEICNHHHDTLKTDIAIADLKGGSDLEKAKTYLSKICKVDINDLQPEWNYLLEIRRVRNTLVHHSGIIAPDNSDRKILLSFIEKENGIEVKEKPTERKPDLTKEDLTIMITGQGFNGRLLANAERFFKKLLEGGSIKLPLS